MDQRVSKSVVPDVLDLVPALRAYARSLCKNSADADDLVQETLLKALSNIEKFEAGSRLRAWLFTIMRNTFYTNVKIRTRESTGGADCVAGTPTSMPTQEWYLRGQELMESVNRLPSHYREMIILVVMLGESYEAAAEICDCAIGTVKSRVNRARQMIMDDIGDAI